MIRLGFFLDSEALQSISDFSPMGYYLSGQLAASIRRPGVIEKGMPQMYSPWVYDQHVYRSSLFE